MLKMENNGFRAADASPFFLVEVTGDSEVDCSSSSGFTAGQGTVLMDEDDAESCCCGPSSDDIEAGLEDLENGSHGVKDAIVLDDDDGEEEGEVRIRSWLRDQEPKSCVSADSVNEFMNERERSKLFWETCLAS